MNKLTLILITLVLILIISYSVTKKQRVLTMPVTAKTVLFSEGSKQKIRLYLESSGAEVGSYDYYLLIINNRYDILEMLFRDYKLDPNFSAQYKKDTPLIDATRELNIKAVKILIKYGADVNYVKENGDTPLTITVEEAFARPKVKYKSREISKLLIDAGADVNAVGKWNTPLGGAIASEDMVNAKYMVEHDADITYLDIDGASYIFGCFEFECVTFFLDKGLDINAVNKNGQSFIQNAVTGRIKKTEEIAKLIELGADICHKDNEGLNILNYIEEANMNPHWKSDEPKVYKMHLLKNKSTMMYKYLYMEYNKRCLDNE